MDRNLKEIERSSCKCHKESLEFNFKKAIRKKWRIPKKFKFDTPEDDHDPDPDPDTDNDPLNDSITEDKSLSSSNLHASTKEVGEPKKEELSADESDQEFSLEEQTNTVDDSPPRPRIPQNNNRHHSEDDCEIDSYSPVIKKRKHGHDDSSKTDSFETVLSSPASQMSKYPHMSYPSTQYTLLFDMEEDTIPFFVDTLTEEFPFDETPISIDPLQNQNDSSNWSLDCYDLYRPDVNSVFNGWWLQQDTGKDPFDNTIL